MEKQQSTQIKTYIKDTELFRDMRIDLLRSSIMGFISVILFMFLINYLREQDNGLHTYLFLISGLMGLAIVLYKPGRPAQTARATFGIPKKFTEYEKKLNVIMLNLRERSIVILSTVPYFLWLVYLIYIRETSSKNDFSTLFMSCFLSFFVTLSLAAAVQYFQIWWSLGKERER